MKRGDWLSLPHRQGVVHASRLTAALLATTCLTTLLAGLALADGGAGSPFPGNLYGTGGAGGTGFTGNPGQAGVNTSEGGSGGGGGGAGGGSGGAGVSFSSSPLEVGGAGGAGGTSSSPNGQPGGGSYYGGSGGGGGGWNGNGAGAATISNGSPLAGGSGGNSGESVISYGGGGGAGGYGAVVTGSAPSSNTSTITGGMGGTGGLATAGGGYGGDGGVGVQFTASGVLFTNSGSGIVTGGTGGSGGFTVNGDTAGNGGGGGAGIVGNGLDITNIGTIAGGGGGSSASGTPPGNGGAGGAGIVGSGLAIANSGTIAGGVGKAGGGAANRFGVNGGAGGAGGAGIVGSGLAITNSGTIAGGMGASGGVSSDGGASGAVGAGGAGIVGSGLAITNSGTIRGGLGNAGSGAQANAITFTGGTNSLTLLAGSTISGNVAGTGSNTLSLGGSSSSSFAVSAIGSGAQFQGFSTFQKTGSSTWTLTGTTTAVTPWIVSAGTLSVSADSNLGASSGRLTLNGGTLQSTATFSSDRNVTLNAGLGTFDTASGTLTLNGVVSGTGDLYKKGSGTLTLNGANTFTGTTIVNAGTLVVNGSLARLVAVHAAGTLSGTGSIEGLIVNGGIVAPGNLNSIGTLTANGSFVTGGGTFQVAVNSAGQSSRLNVTAALGNATIDSGAVTATALAGSYGSSTKYTILTATGGVSGSYSSVSVTGSSLLSPSLSYDANNVYLTLMVNPGAFSFAGNSTNQKAVGAAFDRTFANAGGDFGTVVGSLFGLTSAQLPAAYDALSGQPIANFGTVNVQSAALFMNALGQQMSLARGATAGSGQRQALAQACEIAACDAASPFSVWGSLLGGLGSVQGDGNASTLTYNVGGGAAGIDYRIDPRFVVGLGAGYTHGTQWVNNVLGQGWSDSVSVAAYGSFTQGGFYADALAGYAHYSNQLQRQIVIPGLQPRTTTGSAGANQFLGQIETGYRFGLYAPAQASLTPFARLQGSTVTQNGFNESGAQSLNLDVAQQTTNSLRTLFGADLAGAVPLGNQRQLDLGLRLGWQHEYANTGRPMTAAFAGAPQASFTVYGATPQRDAAVLGFSAATRIAEAAQIYLRYDGEISSGTDNHTLSAGVRFRW